MNTELEILVKIIVGVCSVFGLMKLFSEISINRKTDLREDFEFSMRFFNEYNNNQKLSPILIEKGLKAVVGARMLSTSEILYLLKLRYPTKNINRYIISQDYLAFDEKKIGIKISYSKFYKSKFNRNIMKAMSLGIYVISFLPVVLSAMFSSSLLKFGNVITIIFLEALLIYTAWVFLKKNILLHVAEDFICEQELDENQIKNND